MRVLLIHGRAQQGKDPRVLKGTWLGTLEKGLAAAGVTLPDHVTFDFPFYGDKLNELTEDSELPSTADVVSKGPGQDRAFETFMQSALDDPRVAAAIAESLVRHAEAYRT